jgi:ABC-type uncharacterized transport system substrate-binding protein
VILVDSEDPQQNAAEAGRLAAEGVDLIHAVGTPNTVAATTEATAGIPIVYYGAHPEGIGDQACRSANVTGEILALPFTSNYKRFRLLRSFLPGVARVWAPFYEGTVFVRPRMREIHGAARDRRDRAGRRVWLRGEDEEVGFQTLAGLAYVIDVRYRELVYSDSGELERALDEVDPRDGVLMPYNESFHCPGALQVLLRVSRERRIPLVWNNNAQVTTIGALSGIGADFAKLGRTCGRTAAAILAGAHPRDLPRRLHDDQIAWINLDTADHLGLDLSEEVLGGFDRRIQGESDVLCM